MTGTPDSMPLPENRTDLETLIEAAIAQRSRQRHRCAALWRELLRIIDIDRFQSAYRVRLRKTGAGLEWLTSDGDKEMILNDEPDSTPWQRIKSWLLSPFVPEEQL